MSNFFEPTANDLKNKTDRARKSIDSLLRRIGFSDGNPWPQTKSTANLGLLGAPTKGFLPPVLIPPLGQAGPEGSTEIKTEFFPYLYQDWRGHQLTPGAGFVERVSEIEKKFNKSGQLPSTDIRTNPYSTRDTYLIFGDTGTDYFRHGLQVLNNLNTDFFKVAGSTGRLSSFTTTPWELNDPVIFGFELIIDTVNSPLLNGSIDDFINKFGTQISEIGSRKAAYEEFKQQFVKIFKTTTPVVVDNSLTKMTGIDSNPATADVNEGIFLPGKRAYMSYYLKKIGGLEKLAEGNTGKTYKYLASYKDDTIELEFSEDVSLTLGTLAHLYKLLYWSKPNGKGLIPENLLRFNCEIIVSEVRNFNRVRRAVDSGNIEVIKDNVSRYVYSLRECQFYFSSMPHESVIDLGSERKVYETYNGLKFDYKYSTVNFEKWTAGPNRTGTYVGYNGGSIWKIGNPGARGNSATASNAGTKDTSLPKFFTTGLNRFNQNGVTSPFVIKQFSPTETLDDTVSNDSGENVENQEKTTRQRASQAFNKFKESSLKKGAEALKVAENALIRSATREIQSRINTRVGLLNASINKILNASGASRISPPRNIYTGQTQGSASRLFYDVRGDLLNFLGSGVGSQFGGSSGTIVTP